MWTPQTSKKEERSCTYCKRKYLDNAQLSKIASPTIFTKVEFTCKHETIFLCEECYNNIGKLVRCKDCHNRKHIKQKSSFLITS